MLLPVKDGDHMLNKPFSMTESKATLASSNANSAPELDSISYDILRKYPDFCNSKFCTIITKCISQAVIRTHEGGL